MNACDAIGKKGNDPHPHAAQPRRRARSSSTTTGRASPRRSSARSSTRSSPPSRSASARASASRSRTASSSATAAASRRVGAGARHDLPDRAAAGRRRGRLSAALERGAGTRCISIVGHAAASSPRPSRRRPDASGVAACCERHELLARPHAEREVEERLALGALLRRDAALPRVLASTCETSRRRGSARRRPRPRAADSCACSGCASTTPGCSPGAGRGPRSPRTPRPATSERSGSSGNQKHRVSRQADATWRSMRRSAIGSDSTPAIAGGCASAIVVVRAAAGGPATSTRARNAIGGEVERRDAGRASPARAGAPRGAARRRRGRRCTRVLEARDDRARAAASSATLRLALEAVGRAPGLTGGPAVAEPHAAPSSAGPARRARAQRAERERATRAAAPRPAHGAAGGCRLGRRRRRPRPRPRSSSSRSRPIATSSRHGIRGLEARRGPRRPRWPRARPGGAARRAA